MHRFLIPITDNSMPPDRRRDLAAFIDEQLGIDTRVESEYFVIDAKDHTDAHVAKIVIWAANASYIHGRDSMRPKELGEFPIVA